MEKQLKTISLSKHRLFPFLVLISHKLSLRNVVSTLVYYVAMPSDNLDIFQYVFARLQACALYSRLEQKALSKFLSRPLDQDLGLSGKEMSNRDGFKTLVADVSMNRVRAIFVLEVSRLSRSCTDWYRLLEICAIAETLLIDEDGCYNPISIC